MFTSVTLRDDRLVITLLASLLAGLAGIIIATQSPMTSFLILGIAAFAVLAAITPLTALTFLLVLAPMRTLIATEAVINLPIDIGQMSFVVLVAAYGVSQIARHRLIVGPIGSVVYIPIGLFALVVTINVFAAVSIGAWLNEWLKWIIILVLITLVLNLGSNGNWRWIVFALVVAAVSNAILGLYIFFGGSGALHLLILNRFFRAFGTFGQPNPFGGFMGLVAPIALMMAYAQLMRLRLQWRYYRSVNVYTLLWLAFYGAAALLIVIGVFISWSRGAWLGFGISMLVVLFVLPPRLWQGITIVGLLGGAGVIAWQTSQLPVSITARIASATQELFVLNDVRAVNITTENYAIVERLSHWQAALNMAQEHPWLGVGMGNYEVVYDQYRLINWKFALGHAHNYYLNVLAEAGIIGLTFYTTMFISISWFMWRLRAHPDVSARAVGIGLLGMWVYLAAHSLTDNLYVNNLFVHIGVMLGILAVLHREISTLTYVRGSFGNR